MSKDNKTTVTPTELSFQFYHHVKYLGECSQVNDTRMFDPGPALPVMYKEIPGILLTFIAFILNGLSLIVFCVDESVGLRLRRSSPECTSTAERNTYLTGAVGAMKTTNYAKRTVSFGLSKKSTRTGAKRSSVTLSLLILCTCECVFTLAKVLFRISIFTFPLTIDSQVTSMDDMEWMKRRIQTLPVVENLLFYISDVALMCRNWCVCLITIARAEVVMWPLGSRRWQRTLRTRKFFLRAILIILAISMILAYVKHADLIGLLCFDSKQMRFALWMHEFVMDQDQFSTFELFGYHLIQCTVVWLLIFILTVLIITHLKPWKQDVDILFSPLDNTSTNHRLNSTLATQKVGVQADAMRRRQQSQLRATRVVIAIVVLFLVLESVAFVSSGIQFAGLISPHVAAMRTLESVASALVSTNSIANFVVFILTLKQFRLMCLQIFCCRNPPTPTATSMALRAIGQVSPDNNRAMQNAEITEAERTQIKLE